MSALNNIMDAITTLQGLPAGSYATSTNGTSVDLFNYAGQIALVLDSAAGTGTSPTNAVKLQDSADNSTFADVENGALTTVTNAAASRQKKVFNITSLRRYVRVVSTIGGSSTPTFVQSAVLLALPKYPS